MTVPFSLLWREAAGGKSIGRILTNQALLQWREELLGLVLDLACGQSPSYRRILKIKGNPRVKLVGVDHTIGVSPQVVADLRTSLPFRDHIAEAVILSSFLYIVAEPGKILQETQRVLKQNGLLLLTVPFIYPYNPEPTDYWRFSPEALHRLLYQAGFHDTRIVPIGERWTAAAYLLAPFMRPRWLLAPFAYWILLKLDRWTMRWFRRWPSCPIGYVVKARA